MALSIKKTSARQLGQNSDRDVFAVYSGSKLYKHKTKSGMVFKFATTRSRAEEILKKLKSAGSSSAPKRAGASQPKARAPSSSSAKMTVSSCSQFLRDAGYSVSKKKGKKTEDEEMSDQDIYLRDLMNPRRRRTRRKNPAQSVYVVTFRIGGGRDKYEDTIMASSQAEAIRLAEDMMDEMGGGVLVSIVPQAVADAEIIFDFNNPRRKRRRKNPRAMRRLR